MNTERVLDITLNEKGCMYAMAERRQEYVDYLQTHKHNSQMNNDEKMEILEWTKTKMISSNAFH